MKNLLYTICVLILTTNLHAQTTILNGQTYTINQSSGSVEALNGTTVNISDGGNITGGFALPVRLLAYTTSIYSDATSTTNLTGGSVFGTVAPSVSEGNISGIAIYTDGMFSASGGLAQGGAGAAYQGGGWGLLAHGNVDISGGTFQGGTPGIGGEGGNAAIVANLNPGVGTTINVSGGTFQGAATTSAAAFGGTGLEILSGGTTTISGGTFSGGLNGSQYGGQNDYSLTFSGGGQSVVDISGGKFMSPLEASLAGNDSFSFFGSAFDVQTTPSEPWRYQVSGVLADGTPLNIQFYTNANTYTETLLPTGVEQLTFNFTAVVPEPASWLLLLVGIAGLIIYQVRK
jgi:hypothetical protein